MIQNFSHSLSPHSEQPKKENDNSLGASCSPTPMERYFTEQNILSLSNQKLAAYKDRHLGQRCVIIGNGPSLNKMDLSFLKHEITFGMNRIFLLFEKWDFRPTYYASVNPLVLEQSAEEILKISAPKFLSDKGIPFFPNPPEDVIFIRSLPKWFFSCDPREGLCEGWTVTFFAMQLAYFMGFSEVILIGVDHHFTTQGDPNKEVISQGDDPNHFHPDYFGKGIRWHLPDLERSEGSYRMAKEAFEKDGRKILDATVGGKLTIFTKVDYLQLFCTSKHQNNIAVKDGQHTGTNSSPVLQSALGYHQNINNRSIPIELYRQPPAGTTERFVVVHPTAISGPSLSCYQAMKGYEIDGFGRGLEAVQAIIEHIFSAKLGVLPTWQANIWEECLVVRMTCQLTDAQGITFDITRPRTLADISPEFASFEGSVRSEAIGRYVARLEQEGDAPPPLYASAAVLNCLGGHVRLGDLYMLDGARRIAAAALCHRKQIDILVIITEHEYASTLKQDAIQKLRQRIGNISWFNNYQSIPLVGLQGERTLKRFALMDMGLLRDALVMDFGCNLGQACIKAVQAGAREVWGVEGMPDTFELATAIADLTGFANLNYLNISFNDSDFDAQIDSKIPEYADYSFFFSVYRTKELTQRDRLFQYIIDKTRKGLFFEGHAHQVIDSLDYYDWLFSSFKLTYQFLGYSEGNLRPLFFIPLEGKTSCRTTETSQNTAIAASPPAVASDSALDKGYLVSAIVSTYKSERFMEGKLRDLLRQTLGERLEIIVIDSNSPENERAIVEKFKVQHGNIKYIRTNERETVYQAWNRGIKAASGKYVTNANTDDRLRFDALEILANELEHNPGISLVYADFFITNTENMEFSSHIRTGYSIKPDYSPAIMLHGCHMGPQPLWRKSIHDEIGYFDESLTSAGDYEFWCRIACNHAMKHIPEFLGLYFHNPGGVANRNLELGVRETNQVRTMYRSRLPAPATNIPTGFYYRGAVTPAGYVNIGIITFNRLEFTRQAIEALLIQTDHPYTLTVVDNNSQDGTREYLREQHRRGIIKNLVLLEENVGVAKASNLAWNLEPEALYYMKLDNDIVIQKPGWLSRLVACCDAIPQAGAVGYNFEPVSYPVKEVNGWRVRVKDKGNLGGACILIPRRTHDKLGFWCEDYGLYGEEDADYGLRIMLSGLLNIYMEDEEVGFHLPAGRAAIIDPVTFVAQDGKEELDYAEYRNWKDQQRRQNVLEGAFWKNVELYFSGTKPLYCFSDYLSSPSGPKMLETARISPLRVVVYSLDNPLSACAQIRIIQPAKELGDNISITWGSTNDLDTVQAADLILIQCFYPRQDTLPFIEHMLASGKPIIYEVDDLLIDIPDTSHLKQGAEEASMLLGKLLPRFTALTVSTSLLREAFLSLNPNIYVIPNLIDETIFNPFPRKAAGRLIIGFCGTVSHARDLQGIEDALCCIAEKYGERIGFFFMGQTTSRLAALPGVTFKEFEPGYENYAKVLSESQIDIAIVPLEDKAFNRCKSNIKWLEYSACGIAGIYADLPPYNTCITQGETGILVGNKPQQWFSAIDLLIGNPDLRLSIAQKARQKVMTDCTLKSGAWRWLDVYRDIAAKHGDKRDTVPVSNRSAKVSIIIPVFNQLPFTKQCLDGLFATLPVTLACEIIVVDNGSTDETPDYLCSLAGRITILSNRENLGFAKACNQGGQSACGEILLFLNNDTIPKPGWIESLIAAIDNDEADICGARLLYPDGRCQHAGIAFDERGLGYHVFGGFPADSAPVMERRLMQAITGACLTVRKRLFHELGGFDEGFRNGFEDIDLCLRAREKGKRILYVPESVLVHYAEQTVGRKDNDINNMQRYFSRWQGKVHHDDANLYTRFGLTIPRETDGHITVTPAAKSPVEVSIIIPLFNKAELTRACLQALERVTAKDSYELLLVDNCSSDNTVNLLQEWEPKATIIRNSENRGFAVACNQGALAAKGKYLLFLNNDTEVTCGWLQPLITTLANDPSVAAVGSKLLFPDGTIQHAGVMVVNDQASKDPLVGRHYYVRLAGNYPPANRMMRMQAVTAACILIRRTAFEAVGGFDEGYWNGYEDLDLCFKLGEQNWKIIYQPASVILHHESQSGPERYRQAKNNISRLHARWLGKIKPDVIIMPDKRVLKGDGMLEGLVGEYECPASV
jgi:GT2 family glycosyltransferase/glycosyltransferase involved in cell wall biosynthesis